MDVHLIHRIDQVPDVEPDCDLLECTDASPLVEREVYTPWLPLVYFARYELIDSQYPFVFRKAIFRAASVGIDARCGCSKRNDQTTAAKEFPECHLL